MDSYNEEKATQDCMTHDEEKVRVRKEAIDAFMVAVKNVDANNSPAHTSHSHCHQCGAEAVEWEEKTRTWWCDRCAAADDHKRLAAWLLQHFGKEIREGSLSDNVIRLLSQRDDTPSLPKKKDGRTTFNLICTMKDRWVPQFLAMLKYMQQLGNMGGSRNVCFYADGDGDFNPKFKWDESLPSDAEAVKDNDGDKTFDAG